jgi:diaminopimelate epimerase
MELHFYKYQGAGNDFILLDNRTGRYSNLNTEQVAWLCDRHFGIGADGLMLVNMADGYDFEMKYYNSDGRESTMCGNGGRCIVAFAHKLDLVGNHARFVAVDGPHDAVINHNGTVDLQMKEVDSIVRHADHTVLNTGSPHYVTFLDDVDALDVKHDGAAIRYNDTYRAEGINVNFVTRTPTGIKVRTYERGVEDETLSCGTGVTASAIASVNGFHQQHEVAIVTPGGNLAVRFEMTDDQHAQNVWLCGPATFVFEGTIKLP